MREERAITAIIVSAFVLVAVIGGLATYFPTRTKYRKALQVVSTEVNRLRHEATLLKYDYNHLIMTDKTDQKETLRELDALKETENYSKQGYGISGTDESFYIVHLEYLFWTSEEADAHVQILVKE
jgi:hypothetical protein